MRHLWMIDYLILAIGLWTLGAMEPSPRVAWLCMVALTIAGVRISRRMRANLLADDTKRR